MDNTYDYDTELVRDAINAAPIAGAWAAFDRILARHDELLAAAKALDSKMRGMDKNDGKWMLYDEERALRAIIDRDDTEPEVRA